MKKYFKEKVNKNKKRFAISIFILISASFYSQIRSDVKPICIYFKHSSLKFNHTKNQLDSIVNLLDSIIVKYQQITVIPISLSYEISSDKYIDFKRAQTALEYYKKHSKLDRGKFYVLYFEHEVEDKVKMKRYDSEYNNKCFVSFEPMFNNSNMNEIKSDTSKIENDEEMWFIKD